MQQFLALLKMSTTGTAQGVMNAVIPPFGTFRLALLKDSSAAISAVPVLCATGRRRHNLTSATGRCAAS